MKIIIGLVLLTLIPFSAYANWKKGELVVKGKWGQKPGQFGLELHDSGEDVPMGYCVTGNGHIVIGDSINTRFQVFSANGRLFSSFKAKNITKVDIGNRWPINIYCFNDSIASSFEGLIQIYDLNGVLKYEWKDIVGGITKILNDDSFITIYDKTYYKYTPQGKMLFKYDGIPAEIGERLSEEIQNQATRSTIKVNETVYSVSTASYVESYSLDDNGNINILSHMGYDPVNFRYSKFDKCGKLLAFIDLPHNVYDPKISQSSDIFANNMESDCRIYKWKWQGKNNMHTGPPPPANTRTKPMPDRIIVRWNPSPQDPGCVTGYEIGRKEGDGGSFEVISKVSNNMTEYKDESVLPGKVYIYRVRALSGNLFSDYSIEATGKLKVRKPSQ